MSINDMKPLRRRSVALVLAVAGCSLLVILPIIGLYRINEANTDSHDLTTITTGTDELTTRLLQLITGSLAQYGTTHTNDARTAATDGVDTGRRELDALRAESSNAQRLGIGDALATHLAKVQAVLDNAGTYITEIDAGHSVADAPSTNKVVAAASTLLSSQGSFTVAVGPTSLKLDGKRNDRMREAQLLLGGAVAVALLTFGVLLVLDNRRVRKFFGRESERRQEAERLAAHRADVVNMASHELRNPLTTLTLTTDILGRTAEQRADPEMNELAHDAHVAARRCEALVDELLDLGRLDADRLHLRLGATPLQPALSDAVAMSQAQHGERPVQLAGPAGTPVEADPARLRIIVRNLIDNAFKYSPPGSPVHVTIAERGGRVTVEVRDEGLGVAPGDRERIFQRFERLASGDVVGGVGIGLYLSRELARRMNGDLRCTDSQQGALFRLDLPRAS